MKKFFLITCFTLLGIAGNSQSLTLLDKGEIFTAPDADMVVMDKFSFARMAFTCEKYDTLKQEVLRYDSLLEARDNAEKDLRTDYENELANKDLQVHVISESYEKMKATAQESIDQQNKLQVDYLKLEKKNRRVKRWRNFFMGTSAVLGAVIYIVLR